MGDSRVAGLLHGAQTESLTIDILRFGKLTLALQHIAVFAHSGGDLWVFLTEELATEEN
jgi:hypothetical protein